MSIFEKLSLIQEELKAPKNQYNDYGKYSYRNCEDILEAVKPLCKKNNTTLILFDEPMIIGERYYIRATATLVDLEDANATIAVVAYAREEESKKGMDGSQVTGAASSYARKYALNGLFCIDDAKDSDYTNTGNSAPKQNTGKQPQQKATPQQQPEAHIEKCDMCGKYILPVRKGNGEIVSVDEILLSCKNGGFQKKLCYRCLKQAAEVKKQELADAAAEKYEQDAMNMGYEPYPQQEPIPDEEYKAYR